MSTGNLELPQIATNQDQKEQTSNDADAKLENALTTIVQVDLTSSNVTLTKAQFENGGLFEAINNSVSRSITFPAWQRASFVIKNSGSASVDIKVGTTTIPVGTGATAILSTDGTTNGLEAIFSASAVLGTVPTGGTTHQVLRKISGTDYDIEWAETPYDLGIFFPGQPGASALMLRFIAVRDYRLPSSLTGSEFAIGTNPTSTLTLTLKQNGSSIGSISFNTSGVPSATFSSDVDFTAGDLLDIVAPMSPDATGADFALSFKAKIL